MTMTEEEREEALERALQTLKDLRDAIRTHSNRRQWGEKVSVALRNADAVIVSHGGSHDSQ